MVKSPSTKLFQPPLAWIAILGFTLVVVLCLGVGFGSILRLAFPAGSLVVGAFLFFRYPLLYIGFTWWIWFLAALVRRLVDLQAGYTEPSVLLLAPFLVSGLSILTFIRDVPKAMSGAGFPFVLCMIGIIHGTLAGFLNGEITTQSILVALLNWLTPLTFGFHLYSSWRQFPAVRQITQRVFVWGVLVMGFYGVVQFLIAPAWDRAWLQGTLLQTFGTPQPLGIRVWSTMHSPQPFAAMMMAGLFMLFATQSPLKLPASALGYLSFLLSLARSAWLSWFIGIVVFLPSLKPKFQMRLIVTLMAMMLLVLPLTTIEPFSTAISSRLQTFTSGTQDISYAERTQGYNKLLSEAVTEFTGKGIGYVIKDMSIGSNDSGILTMLINLGWVGTLPYLSGLILLIVSILRSREAAFDPFVSASRAIAIATFSQISLNNVMLQVFGMVLWGFIGLSMAARQYYAQKIVYRPPNNQEAVIP
jgi:hypothetical protein